MPGEPTLAAALQAVARAVSETPLADAALEERLGAIRAAHPELEGPGEARDGARAFVSDAMRETFEERDPLLVHARAELAWRVAAWLSEEEAAWVALFAGARLWRADDRHGALGFLDRALRVAGGDPDVAVAAECLRLACWEELRRHGEVEAGFARVADGARAAGSATAAAWAVFQGALAAQALGRLDEAERRFGAVLGQLASVEQVAPRGALALVPTLSVAWVLRTWGNLALAGNDVRRAIELYQRGRAEARAAGDARTAAWCLSDEGIAWQRLGERARGDALLAEAADEAEAVGDTTSALRWRQGKAADARGGLVVSVPERVAMIQARLRREDGTDPAAEAAARVALEDAKAFHPETECLARNLLAECYRRRGAMGQAIAAMRAAILRAEAAGYALLAVQFRTNLAALLFRHGRLEEAEQAARDAVARGEALREGASSSELRQALGAGLASAYELLLLLAGVSLETPEGQVRPPDAARVLELSQQARSRNFDGWLELANWSMAQTSCGARDAAQELLTAETCVEAAASAGASLAEPFARRDRAARALAVHRPAPPARRPLAAGELARHLAPGAVLVDLNPVEEGVVWTAVWPDGRTRGAMCRWHRRERTDWAARWSEALAREVERVRAQLPRGATRAVWRLDDAPAPSGVAASSMADVAQELSGKLFAPVLAELGARPERLVFSPHAELFAFPFWAAERVAPGVAISCVPSAPSVAALAERPPPAAGEYVKIGDATGNLELVGLELDALEGHRRVEPRLDALRRALGGARRIHFAGHGHFDRGRPYESGIVLEGLPDPPFSLPARSPGCVLHAIPGIIRDFDLAACELAVVSACSTGMPRPHEASEFTSVPGALLARGARNVIAAAWPAHDAATVLFMRELYAALAETGSPALALATARRALRELRREDAVTRLGRDDVVPEAERPFAHELFTDAFQHFGVD